MFTYLDPSVRERLLAERKLVRIDRHGRPVASNEQPAAGELTISLLGPIPLPLPSGDTTLSVDWYAAVRHTELDRVEALAGELRERGAQHLFSALSSSMAVNSVLRFHPDEPLENPLVRVHSSCLTGDVFGSMRCECGPQLDAAIARIHGEERGGLLIYMSGHEGRGIGLWAKAATYLLQDAGENTYQANESLGLPADSRDFSDAGALIGYFVGQKPFRLLSNNPKKLADLAACGLGSITPVRHIVGVGPHNRRYLQAKRSRGHRFDSDDLDAD